MNLAINYYKSVSKNTKKVLVFVGGSGDNKDSFVKTIDHLAHQLPDYNFCTFSVTKPKFKTKILHQTVSDLESVLNCLLAPQKSRKISIFCTSMGAYSTAHLLTNLKYKSSLDQAIFCDPADYYLDQKKVKTWSGSEEYSPQKKTASSLLKKINSKVQVHVIHFTLKKNSFPRLNTKMVIKFYRNVPKKNRGLYLENKHIPHAINRDGDILKNHLRLSKLILKSLISN